VVAVEEQLMEAAVVLVDIEKVQAQLQDVIQYLQEESHLQ